MDYSAFVNNLIGEDHSGHSGHNAHSGHEGGHAGHGNHGGTDAPTCNMNMVFTWDSTDLCVVFRWWHVRTTIGLILTLLTIIALSASYEFVRYRIRVLDNDVMSTNTALSTNGSISKNNRIRQAIGYAVQVGYSYLLMLIFMTYNGWAMISVCIGAGLGFWLWGDKAQKSMSCH